MSDLRNEGVRHSRIYIRELGGEGLGGVFGFGRLGVREWTGGVGWPVRRLGSISSSAEMGDSI